MTVAATAVPAARRRPAAVHPVLFAAYAVLFLWSQNLGEADPADAVVPLLVLVGAALGLTLVFRLIFRDRRRGAIVASPIIVALAMYGHAANLVRPLGIPGAAQQLGWALLVVLALIAAWRFSDAWIDTLDRLLDGIALLLVLVALIVIVPFEAQAVIGREAYRVTAPPPASTTAKKRDVYWLVFDRYGSHRSLQLAYGVDNDLIPWLEEHGFDVLEDSHANYIRTVLSMSTTMQMEHLDEIAARMGPGSRDISPVIEGLQDSPVVRQFRALGYRNYHVGVHHDPTRTDRGADVNLNLEPNPVDFVEALFDASAGPAIAKRLGIPDTSGRDRAFRYTTYALDAIEGLRDEPGPKFVMGHLMVPHPPMVFDVDGSFIDDEEAATLPWIEEYRRQLAFTNRRIREIVEPLLALPEDEQPIIILQADEGPYPPSYTRLKHSDEDWDPQASGEDFEIKYGILNAWHVPGEDLELDERMTAINTFPTLFSRYFGLDYESRPDRIYASHDWLRPYDLTDITNRMPSLQSP